MYLKNKRILITAGPTWVPIDKVRVISNIATGQTGIVLADKLSRIGAKVTLLLGPVKVSPSVDKKIRIVNFCFFDQLRKIVKSTLKARDFDIIIHSAAVSDFEPAGYVRGKIDSTCPVNLKLKPLPKIIKDIRSLAPKARLVMFKLESGVSDKVLIKRSLAARVKVGADMVAANRLDPYAAFIIESTGKIFAAKNKGSLINKLIERLKAV